MPMHPVTGERKLRLGDMKMDFAHLRIEDEEIYGAMEQELQLLIAQAICKGISKEEMCDLVECIYQKLDKNQEEL